MAAYIRETGFDMNMPILTPVSGLPTNVEIPLSCESQAKRNHGGQSLERLRERGGLAPCEAVAIVEMRAWQPMNAVQLVDAFRKHGWL